MATGTVTEAGTDASSFEYVSYTNAKFGFSVDVPAFFVKGPADGDGRGQPWGWKGKATMRAWGMYNVPVMTKEALFGDWTRRSGVLTKESGDNWWVVTAKDGPTKLWYSKSYLEGGVITTAELSYDVSLKDELAPILEHIGASLKPGSRVKRGVPPPRSSTNGGASLPPAPR
jgi:hypothetical protein